MRNSSADRNMSPPETDWAVTAEPQHRVRELASVLAAALAGSFSVAVEGAAAEGLWLDGARLDPDVPLARSGIRNGARLGLGGRPPASRYPVPDGLTQIRVVAGPDAGMAIPT